MPEKKEEAKEKKDEVELTEVVTGTAPAFKLPTGEVLNFEQYLVWLGNCIWFLRKNIG